MKAINMTAPYIKMLQFMVAGVGLGDIGKNAKTSIGATKASEMMLMGRPSFPRLKADLGKGSFVVRRQAMQPIEQR